MGYNQGVVSYRKTVPVKWRVLGSETANLGLGIKVYYILVARVIPIA